MNNRLYLLLHDIDKITPGVSDASVKEIQEKIGFEFPMDYLEVMKEFNGGEGEVGENSWLYFFSMEELISTNNNYSFLMNEIPDYYLFGKDAADTGYAFHKKNKTAHSFGLMSNFKKDKIILCGNNFTEFLEYLYNY